MDENMLLGAMRAMLKEELEPINTRLDVLQADVTVVKVDISNLQADVTVMKADISNLQADVTVMKADISNLQTEMVSMNERMTSLDEQMTSLDERMDVIEGKQDALSKDIFRLNHYVEPAFKSIQEGMEGWRERNRQIDHLEDKVDAHDHRIWALEQLAKAN